MTSNLKIFVLIVFHFQDAIFPFNRAAPYGMTSAVPREQSRTSARSAERTLALDPRPHSSAAARASVRFLVRSATERRTSRGEISFQLPFKRYPIKNFGSNRADKSENFPLRGVHTCLKSRIRRYEGTIYYCSLRLYKLFIVHAWSVGDDPVPGLCCVHDILSRSVRLIFKWPESNMDSYLRRYHYHRP